MKIISVNISDEKGTVKKPVGQIELFSEGVRHDAHSGKWHRQVSLLGTESFKKFSALAGRELAYGEFAENLTTEGLILYNCKPLDRFISGDILLEVTQIGKACHGDRCAIYREVGNCVMPKEGIFCRVIQGGLISPGDEFTYHPKVMKVLVITLSDRASSGEYADRSGPLVAERAKTILAHEGWPVEIVPVIIPDDAEQLTNVFERHVNNVDVVFTTGGTGVGPRDITPETLEKLIDKPLPSIMEMIRWKYGSQNPHALLSRSTAGTRGMTPVFALPGSVKGVGEYMDEIGKLLPHLIYMLHGIDRH
jgi:molybdopterin adenylyltransferase